MAKLHKFIFRILIVWPNNNSSCSKAWLGFSAKAEYVELHFDPSAAGWDA
jgi:hypothetical protein